jgi:hypothetical protein
MLLFWLDAQMTAKRTMVFSFVEVMRWMRGMIGLLISVVRCVRIPGLCGPAKVLRQMKEKRNVLGCLPEGRYNGVFFDTVQDCSKK